MLREILLEAFKVSNLSIRSQYITELTHHLSAGACTNAFSPQTAEGRSAYHVPLTPIARPSATKRTSTVTTALSTMTKPSHASCGIAFSTEKAAYIRKASRGAIIATSTRGVLTIGVDLRFGFGWCPKIIHQLLTLKTRPACLFGSVMNFLTTPVSFICLFGLVTDLSPAPCAHVAGLISSISGFELSLRRGREMKVSLLEL